MSACVRHALGLQEIYIIYNILLLLHELTKTRIIKITCVKHFPKNIMQLFVKLFLKPIYEMHDMLEIC